jgi:hypothetical protein
VTLFSEILRQADQDRPDVQLSEIAGIVVIDEIDKHLHIKLQKETLPQLLQLFPKVQFIASSHSPFLGMGLADTLPTRGRIIDLSSGLSIAPVNDPLYQEVYELMLGEEARFRDRYIALQQQIDLSRKLQLITEGANTEHIRKAFELLCPEILSEINIIAGAESKSGAQQLKNAFEIMMNANHAGTYLFVWDCDATKEANALTETNTFKKYLFPSNPANAKTTRGIENNYSNDLFTADVYDEKTTFIEYSGERTILVFNKRKFVDKILGLSDPTHFSNFSGLVAKVRELLASSAPPTDAHNVTGAASSNGA